MYYEEPYTRAERRKPRRRRRKSFGGWLAALCARLVALILGLSLFCGGALYALPVSLFAVEPDGGDLSLTDGLPAAPANVLLLGLDAARENSRRSDAILIASIDYGKVKLTSVLRDTVMDIPGHGRGKINAAYAYGGASLVMKTLNANLGLNLMHYAAVDFRALVDVVDALGGVELTLSEAEADKINLDLADDRAAIEANGYALPVLSHGGEGTRLNGLQALAYARIRKLDSDFGRAGRHRKLLSAMLEKLRASLWNPALLARLARVLSDSLDTNMSPVQLLSLGEKALLAPEPDQLRLPVEGSYTDDGAALTLTDLTMNAYALRRFVWGEE